MCDYKAKDFLSNVLFVFLNTYFFKYIILRSLGEKPAVLLIC